MADKLFNKYFGKTEEELNKGKKGLVQKRLVRAFDSAIDSVEEEITDYETKMVEVEIAIANGDFGKIGTLAVLEIEQEEAIRFKAKVEELKTKFF